MESERTGTGTVVASFSWLIDLFKTQVICVASTVRMIDRSIDWQIGWLIDWSGVRLIDWLIDRLMVDWLIDWLFDWLIVWLTDWLIDWLIDVLIMAVLFLFVAALEPFYRDARVKFPMYYWSLLVCGFFVFYLRVLLKRKEVKCVFSHQIEWVFCVFFQRTIWKRLPCTNREKIHDNHTLVHFDWTRNVLLPFRAWRTWKFGRNTTGRGNRKKRALPDQRIQRLGQWQNCTGSSRQRHSARRVRWRNRQKNLLVLQKSVSILFIVSI